MKTTAVMGSPLYMSPEQMTSSRDVDHRADIWSLGIILFELMTGNVPFSGEMFSEICVKIATQEPPPLRSLRPDAPEGLEAVVNRCLEKDRNRRFGSIGELAQALAPFAPESARPQAMRIARVSSGTDPRLGSQSMASAKESLATSNVALGRTTQGGAGKTNMAVVGVVGGLVLLMSVVGIGVLLRAGKAAPPPVTATAASQIQAVAVVPSQAPKAVVPEVAAPSADTPAPSATAVAPPPGPTAAPVRGSGAGGGGKAGHAATATPAATQAAPPPRAGAKPGCDPNYYLDENGEKHFKKECF